MNDLVNSFKSAALSVGEMITPVLKESKFKETGVLTPEEFVAAGDHLVHHCPTWSWSMAGTGKSKGFLPINKQFLITKHVPCHQRCNQMQYDQNLEKIIDELGVDGNTLDSWVDTHYFDDKGASTTKTLAQQNNVAAASNNSQPTSCGNYAKNDDDDDDEDDGPPVDMGNFLESGALEEEDPNLFVHRSNEFGDSKGPKDDEELIKTRTYDLHITYDKYYQVPRFWLIGYDEQNQPLSVTKMKEDFSQDHADKTITLESHPHISDISFATIHPCRHASVMKRLIEQFTENGKDLSVLDYLFIFLKFVQAVIPTVEYDYTRSIQF